MTPRNDLPTRESNVPAIAAQAKVAPLATGAQFSRYEIESLLASGGMAEVWRARIRGAEGFERRVVIKTMLTQYADRPDLIEMFVREATLAAQLNHPNIVDVFDFGEVDGRYFIAMEYVPGVTLRFAHRRMLARGQRLPVAMLLHVMRDVCEGLQHIHDLQDGTGPMGVVHRDLSPDNIILSTSSRTKLIDFGAARATERTPPGALFVGKYRYAAPERIRQTVEDCRSDVYSAGVILYECLTGARPVEGSDEQVMAATLEAPWFNPRDRIPELSARIGKLVMKATAQNPADRFEDAQELAGAIGMCLSELGSFSKEREVTAALSLVLETEEGVPEPIGAETSGDDSSAETSEVKAALQEVEILEASGPIRAAPPAAPGSTRRPSGLRAVPTPPPGISLRAWYEVSGAIRKPASPLEQAVEFFDRGVALRNESRFSEALESWEIALALAPGTNVYQSNVKRLREELARMELEAHPVEAGNDDTTAEFDVRRLLDEEGNDEPTAVGDASAPFRKPPR
jgi:eukaryotic-like serine/threonine-protein kinase